MRIMRAAIVRDSDANDKSIKSSLGAINNPSPPKRNFSKPKKPAKQLSWKNYYLNSQYSSSPDSSFSDKRVSKLSNQKKNDNKNIKAKYSIQLKKQKVKFPQNQKNNQKNSPKFSNSVQKFSTPQNQFDPKNTISRMSTRLRPNLQTLKITIRSQKMFSQIKNGQLRRIYKLQCQDRRFFMQDLNRKRKRKLHTSNEQVQQVDQKQPIKKVKKQATSKQNKTLNLTFGNQQQMTIQPIIKVEDDDSYWWKCEFLDESQVMENSCERTIQPKWLAESQETFDNVKYEEQDSRLF